MKEVNVATVEMQTDCISLAHCDTMIEGLLELVEKYKALPAMIGDQVNPFHDCPFRVKKLVSGVVHVISIQTSFYYRRCQDSERQVAQSH